MRLYVSHHQHQSRRIRKIHVQTMSLSVSSRPVKSDVLNIATALAKVLNLPAGELSGMDAQSACAWMKAKVPGLDNNLAISSNSKHQKDICQKLSMLLPESQQQREACAGLADLMCDLGLATKSGLLASLTELNSMIGSCKDDACRERLDACKSKAESAIDLLEKQQDVIKGFANEAASISGKNAASWSDKMVAALSGAPTVAEMIILVCDCCCEIESLCAECAANAAAASETVAGGNCGCDEPLDVFKGGWVHGGTVGGLTIDLDSRKQTDARRKAMTTFINEAKDLFDQVLNAVYALGQRMGKGAVALDDDFLRFKNAFGELESVYRPGIEYVLTGYYVHARAAEHRERFLGKLQALISTLVPLSATSNGDLFKKIKEPLEALQRHCDKYSDQFRQTSANLIQTKFGELPDEPTWGGYDFSAGAQRARDALHAAPGVIKQTAQDVREVKNAVLDAANTMAGGDDSIVSGGVLSKAGLTLQNVRRSLEHFYRVAKMRDNMKVVATESKSYNSGYDDVLGKPMAELINKEHATLKKFIEDLQSSSSPALVHGSVKVPPGAAYNLIKRAVEAGSSGDDNIARDWNKEAIIAMATKGRDARVELYEVIQAIDLFLMNFTDTITANPDEIKEISKLLDSTEIVADWFNEATGDYIAGLFEFMPSDMTIDTDNGSKLETKMSPLGSGPNSILDIPGKRLKKIPEHYLKSVLSTGVQPGNPFLMISPARAEYAREFAKNTVNRMMALKNIVAAFVFMGKGRAGAQDSSWEPNRIYGALCKYIYTSAFAMGWDGYDVNAPGSSPESHQFAKQYSFIEPAAPSSVAGGEVYSSLEFGLTGVLPLYGESWSNLLSDLHGFAPESKSDEHDSDYGSESSRSSGLSRRSSSSQSGASHSIHEQKNIVPLTSQTMMATLLASRNNENIAEAVSVISNSNFSTIVENLKRQEIADPKKLMDDNGITDVYKNHFRSMLQKLQDSTKSPDDIESIDQINADIYQRVKQILSSRPKPTATVSGGYLSTYNWTDYVGSLSGAPGSHGWKIAFNPGDNAKNMTIVPPYARCAFGCAMNSIPLPKDTPGPFKTVGGWSCQFRQTDELFIRTIKAMVAKILTVSGMYNALNFTSDADHTLSATRFTVGGGAESIPSTLNPVAVPPVYEDAVELYLRLPLLVEFYRDIYSLTGKKLKGETKDELLVTLVPEMDLTWSGIMRLSFDNMNGAAAVTKNYAAQMIVEINKIYEKYKGRGSSLVTSVVNDFVTDVNRRFGLMSRIESVKYREMMQANRRAYAESSEADAMPDYDTLGDRDYASRPAPKVPSSKYTKSSEADIVNSPTEFKLSFIDAITKFREHIDDKIRAATLIDEKTESHSPIKADFHEQARITKSELKLNTDHDKRFNIVFATMTGIDSLLKMDDNAYVMFHETIIAPMSVIKSAQNAIGLFINAVATQWDRMTKVNSQPDVMQSLNNIFMALTKLLMSHVSGLAGLVDMTVSSQKVIVDHSKLQQFVENMLEFVSRNLQKFRGIINSNTIAKYETMIQEIQTNLVEIIFRNELGVADSPNLELVSSFVTRMYGILAYGEDRYHEGNEELKIDLGGHTLSLCDSIRQLAYYNPKTVESDLADVKSVLTRDSGLERLFMKKIDNKDIWMYEDLLFAARREIYLNENQFSPASGQKAHAMGLMMRFNELFARYLDQFWDESAKKIYLPLILKIAAENDAAVHRATGWPDLMLPHGHSNLPPTIASGPDWASQILAKFNANALRIQLDVPNISGDPNLPKLKLAGNAFIKELDRSSSSMAPTQLISILTHIFDEKASGEGNSVRNSLERFRNVLIQAIGDNWAKYGPIAAIAASTKAFDPNLGSSGASIDTLLTNAKYIPPGVVPAPLSELSGVSEEKSKPFGNPDEILFASLAKVLKTMLTAQDKGVPLYTVASLSDTSATTPRMKENIRANLPIFVKMFSMLADGCKILDKLLTTGIDISDRSAPVNDSARVANSGVQGRVFASNMADDNVPFKDAAAKNYMSRLLARIASSCNAIIMSAAEVMREVPDNPLFLETSENSIAAYGTLNNVKPFMPLSSMLAGLRDTPDSSDVLLPLFMPGSRKFEFNYGTRFILGQPREAAKLDHAPGVREIVENYNKLVQGDRQISLDSIGRAMVEYVQLTRWVTDLNVYAPILYSEDQIRIPIIDKDAFQQQADVSFDSILGLTTGADKSRMIALLSNWANEESHVSNLRRDKVINRELMQIWNLLDMNVNPVNMNALRREVPLINVINYGLTFDSMLRTHTGIRRIGDGQLAQEPMWLALMLNPYRQKAMEEWPAIFDCYGDASSRLNFPGHDRFAQDQVFRKALMYPAQNMMTHKGGPQATLNGYYRYNTGVPESNRKSLIELGKMNATMGVIGAMRHDTTFIRNILFISSVHRLLRSKLEGEMSKITFPVVSGPQVTNRLVTDESPWETYDDVSRAYNA